MQGLRAQEFRVKAGAKGLPIVSIVVPFFGLTKYYNKNPIR